MQSLKTLMRSPRFVVGLSLVALIVLYAVFVPIFITANPKNSHTANPDYQEVAALKAALSAGDDAAIARETERLRALDSDSVQTMLDGVQAALERSALEGVVSAAKQLSKRKQPLVYGQMDALRAFAEAENQAGAEAEIARLEAHCAQGAAFAAAASALDVTDADALAAALAAFDTRTDKETENVLAAASAGDAAGFQAAVKALGEQLEALLKWTATARERMLETGYAAALDCTKVIQPDMLTPKNLPPDAAHWLGTDPTSYDVFLLMAYGARTSLVVGLLAGVIATLIGVTLGLSAGFVGGRYDRVVSAMTNTFIVIPNFIILILISIALGQLRETWITGVIIGLTSWTWTCRGVRAQAISLRNRDHVNMARVSGYGTPKIILTEILPYIASYVTMAFILQVASGVMSEATLAILGLGDPTGISLGRMMNKAMDYEAINFGRWWQFIPVTMAISMITYGLYLMNSGMDRVFNPKIGG